MAKRSVSFSSSNVRVASGQVESDVSAQAGAPCGAHLPTGETATAEMAA
jgi:hypothetical protein